MKAGIFVSVVWSVLVISGGASPQCPSQPRQIIQRIVRTAGSNQRAVNRLDLQSLARTPEVAQWLSKNRESIEGTRGGPFDATKQYVSTYAGHNIYVHVLDWNGKNNLFLPSIIDQPIVKAALFHGPPVRVDQYPWGTLVVVPTEMRPNNIDTIIVLRLTGDPGELAQPRIINENPIRGIMLRGDSAKLYGGLRYNQAPDWIENWKSLRDYVTWRVRTRTAGDYEIAMTYSCAPGCGGSTFEILAGSSKVAGTLRETSGMFGGWMNFEEVPQQGTLHLRKGINEITLRATSKSKTDEILRLYALYLFTPKEKGWLAKGAERARQQRAPTAWFRAAKYGLMVHWGAASQPRSGPQEPFCEAVRDFDVQRFAGMVQETGAAYLIFTLTHGIHAFPLPLKSVDAVLPGRTCSRDLPGDLANVLTKRGIKLIVYYDDGVGDPKWSKASGFLREDKSIFFEHEAAILREVGLRYGSKLAGWWFDNRYPLQHFEELDKAAKAGNPGRIVAFNSWIMPKSTNFQDYWAGEVGGSLLPLPEKGFFNDHGPQSGLQPHVLIFLDDPWMHARPNTPIHSPLYSDQALATYVTDCNQKGAPVTMNIGVYQDGAPSPATLDQLKYVRAAIRAE